MAPRLLSDLLLDLGGLAVAIINTKPDSLIENEWFDDPGQGDFIGKDSVEVSVMLPKDRSVEPILQAVRTNFNLKHPPAYRVEHLPEQDWVSTTQKLSAPHKIGQNIWIVPTWETIPNKAAINIRLDPGIAFGSGTHPTTQLCLEWLEEQVNGGETVLDFGCGSGILAIAALKLGAGSAVGVDIDPQALESSVHNASLNQVMLNTFLPAQLPALTFDLLIANILANPLKTLARRFNELLNPGGILGISGLLTSQVNGISDIYQSHFKDLDETTKNEWVLLSARKQ